MALQKGNLSLSFGAGLDTKTDSKQVTPGKMLSLSNSIFQKGGLLQKRNGFGNLPTLPVLDTNTLGTFGGSLTAIGKSLYNFAPETNQWYNKGAITSVQTATVPLVRSATSQTAQDVAVSATGLSCAVWTDSDGTSKYQVNDSTSSEIVVSAVSLPATSTQPRVFLLGSHFVVTFFVTVTAATHLQYIAIPILNPSVPTTRTDLALQVASLTAGYDGCVINSTLYIAYADAAPAIKILYMNAALTPAAPTTVAGQHARYMSVVADPMTTLPTIYVTWWDNVTSDLNMMSFNSIIAPLLAPTVLVNSAAIKSVTSVANDNLLTAYYQTANTYSYSPNAESDFVSTVTCTSTGTVGTPKVLLRSVGLASKAFLLNSTQYVMVAYGTAPGASNAGGIFQPTYFLTDSVGNIVAKLAYTNGGGYPSTQVLPGISIAGNTAQIGYLYKDLLTSVNKTQGVANVKGIYSQTGINLVTWNLNDTAMPSAEIGNNLHIGGGYMWMYDGSRPVEHNFHVYPEDVAASPSTGVTPSGTTTFGSAVVTALSSMVGVGVGSTITGTGIPGGATIISLSGSDITLSAPATATGTVTLTIQGQLTNAASQKYFYQVTYEWTDAQGNIHRSAPSVPISGNVGTTTSANTLNIPTLRLTLKTGSSKVRIVIYRWSTAQQNYYQVTSIANPVINDPSVDSVTYVDGYSDAAILGNQLIYTTGGVIENIAFPAVDAITLYKSRLVMIDSEDKNLLWYSKQVIETVPVEPSDLFTIYIAPTAGAQGSTGVNTAISSMDDKLVIFKKNALYYITGTGPDNTGANNDFSEPTYITSTAGCTNPQSIVFMPQGLMFQSDKGIWLLGRDLSTNYIGAPVEQYNSATVLSAVTVPATNQVLFTLDNGVTLMYDYFYGQWGTFTGIPAVSSTLYKGLHTYVNATGAVFQETPNAFLDGSNPVLMSFTTAWIAMAGLQGFERAYFFYLLGTYLTPHKLAVSVAYDYDPSISQTSIILPDNYNPPYGLEPGVYGSGDPYGGASNVEQWRVFLQQQKCQSFQLTVTEVFDPQFNTIPGAGLTLYCINLVVGVKKSYTTLRAARSVG